MESIEHSNDNQINHLNEADNSNAVITNNESNEEINTSPTLKGLENIQRRSRGNSLSDIEKSVRLRPRSTSVNQNGVVSINNNNNNNNTNNNSNSIIGEETIQITPPSSPPRDNGRNPMIDMTKEIQGDETNSSTSDKEEEEGNKDKDNKEHNSNDSSVDVDEGYDDDDYDDDDDDEQNDNQDTINNEKGHVEMRELSEDKMKIQKEREEAKKINRRRLGLHWADHFREVTIEYGKVSLVALICCIVCILLAYGYSKQEWIVRNHGTTDYFHKNSVTMLTSTFFIIGLAIFTGIQFWAVFGIKRVFQTKFYLWVLAVIGLFLVVPWGMNAGNEPYYFWLGDVLTLIVGYTGLCFVMGFVGKSYQTNKERFRNGLAFLGTELMVSATALVYGMFLIQLYSNFSNIAKVAWRLLVHPIYFEIFMMIPVRLLVTKQMERKGVSIMHSLAVVHAQAHISTLGRMMISTINQIEFTIVSVILLNVGKMVFRSSVQLRDKAASRVVTKLIGHEHKESKKFVRAVGMYTEMIMENASIPAASFTMWAFYEFRGLFFFPYPDGGTFTLAEAALNCFIQLIFAFIFDIITLWINERYFGLPLERAWKKMRERWLPFFGFLIYGTATMGMVGVIWMACKLPRFVTCSNLDVCTCKFVPDCQQFINQTLS